MTSNNPFTDQIWNLSKCGQFEHNLHNYFYDIIGNKDIYVKLVDTVKKNYKDCKLVVTDNVISNFEYQPLWPEFWGSFSYTPQYQNNIPTWAFNCFINRTCPIRQSWFYQLVRRMLIDQGAVSFLLDYRKWLAPNGLDVENKAEVYQWVFEQGCQIFSAEHELMRSKVPFRNFSGELDQVICDSSISLVIETYFDRADVIAFSEKIFRVLQLPRPFLLYCAPGAINLLKNQGFNVYDDVVDHSYDFEIDNIARQIKILDELENSKYIVYNTQVLEDFEQRAIHNRQLLTKLKNEWPSKLEKVTSEIKKYK